jgi:hypothetical protein
MTVEYENKLFLFLQNLEKNFLSKDDKILLTRKYSISGNSGFTKWVPIEEWKSCYSNILPNYRTIMMNEIVLESDESKEENFELAKKIKDVLVKNNFYFWSVFTGNKSIHFHLICNDLLKIDPTMKKEACTHFVHKYFSEDIVEKLDFSNFNPKRMIQIEVAVNPKTKLLPEVFFENLNGFYISLDDSLFEHKEKKKYIVKEWTRDLCPKNCPSLEFCLKNKFPSGELTRYEFISPSLAAYIRYKPNRDFIAESYYKIQGKQGDLEAWDLKPSNFSCKQIRKFMEFHKKGEFCEKCLGGLLND